MRSHIQRAAVFVLYQLSLLTGIVLLPMAVAMSRVGIELPVHRVVDRFNRAYDHAASNTA